MRLRLFRFARATFEANFHQIFANTPPIRRAL